MESLEGALAWYDVHGPEWSFWDDLPCVFPGFYRAKSANWKQRGMNGPFFGVAIWLEKPVDEEGNQIADSFFRGLFGRAEQREYCDDEHDLVRVFHKCKRHPVSEEAYRHYMAHGVWADDPIKQERRLIDAKTAPMPF